MRLLLSCYCDVFLSGMFTTCVRLAFQKGSLGFASGSEERQAMWWCKWKKLANNALHLVLIKQRDGRQKNSLCNRHLKSELL